MLQALDPSAAIAHLLTIFVLPCPQKLVEPLLFLVDEVQLVVAPTDAVCDGAESWVVTLEVLDALTGCLKSNVNDGRLNVFMEGLNDTCECMHE